MDLSGLPDILTVNQVAELMQISPYTVTSAIRKKALVAYRVGKFWRIEKKAVEKWAKRNTAETE